MSAGSDTPWIVVGKSGSQGVCERCLRTFELKLPVDLDVWLGAMRGFIKAHRGCQPVAAAGGGGIRAESTDLG